MPLRRHGHRHRWDDNVKMNAKERGSEGVVKIYLLQMKSNGRLL